MFIVMFPSSWIIITIIVYDDKCCLICIFLRSHVLNYEIDRERDLLLLLFFFLSFLSLLLLLSSLLYLLLLLLLPSSSSELLLLFSSLLILPNLNHVPVIIHVLRKATNLSLLLLLSSSLEMTTGAAPSWRSNNPMSFYASCIFGLYLFSSEERGSIPSVFTPSLARPETRNNSS